MSKQPEALRLADALFAQVEIGGGDLQELDDAAAELRRLHAINAELLEALRNFVDGCSTSVDAASVARAAIAKAGEQP